MSVISPEGFVFLPNVLLRWSFVFEKRPQSRLNNNPPKYEVEVHMAPDSEAAKIAKAAAVEAFKSKWPDAPASAFGSLPFGRRFLRRGEESIDQKTGLVRPGYAGVLFVKATNDQAPVVVDIDGVTPLTKDSGKLFAGCYVDVKIAPYGTVKGGMGVFAEVHAVRFRKGGEAFGRGPVSGGGFSELPPEEVAAGMNRGSFGTPSGKPAGDPFSDEDIPF